MFVVLHSDIQYEAFGWLASKLSDMGDANTLQQGSLHTALAAIPGPADTWE